MMLAPFSLLSTVVPPCGHPSRVQQTVPCFTLSFTVRNLERIASQNKSVISVISVRTESLVLPYVDAVVTTRFVITRSASKHSSFCHYRVTTERQLFRYARASTRLSHANPTTPHCPDGWRHAPQWVQTNWRLDYESKK